MSNEEGERIGRSVVDIIASIRRHKSENKIPLGADMGAIRLITDSPEELETSLEDIRSTIKARDVTLETSEELREVLDGLDPVFSELGPRYRTRMRSILRVLNDPTRKIELAEELDREGTITFDPEDGGGPVTLTSDMVKVRKRWTFRGRSVSHLTVGNLIVVLEE